MFCFQCEQTARQTACTVNGVCGKNAAISDQQDHLLGKLVALAKNASKTDNYQIKKLIIDALFVTVTNVNFDSNSIQSWCDKVDQALSAYPTSTEMKMNDLWQANEDIRSLKSLLLFSIKGMAAYAHHAASLGYINEEVNNFFLKALAALNEIDDSNLLLNLVLEAGQANLKCMELLDKANTETYGKPSPVKVSTKIKPGPFIVITGHDLKDLHLLLEATKNKGINIYTHGEMLPCHAYPKFKEYPHLKGNFGTAWQSQQKEFANLPAPIFFTTNCIMPVKSSYSDRVFTTSVVSYPDMQHIGEDKDFTPLIEKALELKGFDKCQDFTGINGGNILSTGHGHDFVLSQAGKIIEEIKKGSIKHFFLVGGCDGAAAGRNYYTEFVRKAPKDSIILTLACGKFRFNDLDLGDINGIPRLLDIGQCNDAYGAIKIAQALAQAFECQVNDLPLTLVLSWYEQKAVCILLTLLSLNIKNIYLGPSLPAFVSPNILNALIANWNIKAISNVEDDLKKILKQN